VVSSAGDPVSLLELFSRIRMRLTFSVGLWSDPNGRCPCKADVLSLLTDCLPWVMSVSSA
jgi:hypothetical protein